MKKQENYIFDFLKDMPQTSQIGKYLADLQEHMGICEDGLFNRKYKKIIEQEDKKSEPFLSVIIRTQGKRPDGLREALLCLNVQSNQNFEILLIAHKASVAQKKSIAEILDDQEENIKSKLRYFELDEGTRTTPINFGFAHAWGMYAAIFDDDDILFDNWVESFWKIHTGNEGRILHSYAFAQNWANIKKIGYRAESAPIASYCVPYDFLSQFTVNRCPLMTLAFPVRIFQKWGVIFNEELNVMEDWEYFTRTASICGVSDCCEPTAIYRFWQNIETSATLHDEDAWSNSYKEIQNSFDRKNIIFPVGSEGKIINMFEKQNNFGQLESQSALTSTFYYSKGSSFNEQMQIKAISEKEYPEFDIWFLLEQKMKDIKAMRFDICEEGLFVLENIEIVVWFTNGEKRIVDFKDCVHTGINYGSAILFLYPDPEIVWEWEDERMVDVIHISGKISRNVSKNAAFTLMGNLLPIKDIFKKRELHKKGYF